MSWLSSDRVPQRDQGLDALRGLAIALVVIYHFHQDVPRLWPGHTAFGETGWWAKSMDFFLLGVDLFYVLSGFFIGGAALRASPWRGWPFLRSRLTRILPAYYVSLCVALALSWPAVLQGAQAWWDLGLHLVLLHSYQEWSMFSINGAYWTLSIEMSFYLLMLVLAPWWRGRHGLGLLVALWLVCWVWRAGVWWQVPVGQRYFWCAQLPGAVDEFALGMGVAWLQHRGWLARWAFAGYRAGGAALGAGLLIIMACLYFYVTLPVVYWTSATAMVFSRSGLGLGFALLLLGMLLLQGHRPSQSVLSASTLPVLGRISYSVYLYHTPLIALAYRWGSGWLPDLVMLLAALVTILLVSWASFQGVERRWHPSL